MKDVTIPNRKLSRTTEGQRLAEFSLAVRNSSLKRLRLVPAGRENSRATHKQMSFADLAQHLIDADAWLIRKLAERDTPHMTGRAGIATIKDRSGYTDLLLRLEKSGALRASRLAALSDSQLADELPDDRFGGMASAWWIIIRGNLDHEIHHRGQIDERVRRLLRER
jgi:hypothetical protein